MSTSRIPFQPPTDGIIRFTRTDGSRNRRPITKETAAPDAVNYMDPVPFSDPSHKRWRNIIGDLLVRALHIPAKSWLQYRIADFPEHYILYSKPRESGVTENRDDLYLWGSKTVRNFRSPAEFAYHAAWLLTDPTLDLSNCRCKWCSGTPQKIISKELGLKVDHYSDGTTKQRADYEAAGFGANTYGYDTPPASPVEPAGKTAQSHLRDNPPYRAGELVWAHLRPPIGGDSDGHTIDCWPSIVVEVYRRVWTLPVGGVDRAIGLKLRLLGSSFITTVDAFDAIPYHAYTLPQELIQYMATTTPHDVANELAYDRLADLQLFVDIQKDPNLPRQVTFDRAWPLYVVSTLISFALVGRWSLIRMAGTTSSSAPGALTSAHAAVPEDQKQVPYDAIWWGAECLRVGDLVRLRGGALQDSALLPLVSRGATSRTLFLKIDKIQSRRPTRLSDVWLAGTLYQTVAEDDEDGEGNGGKKEGVDGSSVADLVAHPSLPEPPTGFRFKPILAPGQTSFIQLNNIAGRYYPHLMFSPVFGATRGRNPVALEQLLSLCGLAPGDIWPETLPNRHQERRETVEGVDMEAKKYLSLRRGWFSQATPLKPEPRM